MTVEIITILALVFKYFQNTDLVIAMEIDKVYVVSSKFLVHNNLGFK